MAKGKRARGRVLIDHTLMRSGSAEEEAKRIQAALTTLLTRFVAEHRRAHLEPWRIEVTVESMERD